MVKFRSFLFPVGTSLVCSLVLAGCGSSTFGNLPSQGSAAFVQGTVHGGPNPVVGATVTLYETQVGAGSTYGGAGKVLGTATTGSYGQFTINTTGTYTCDQTPYMQYAYVAVTGGNTGANTTNGNSVLMAALGACSNLATPLAQATTQTFISEATTVAAAYALANFTTVTGAAGAQVVQIGSTPTNDATNPSCSNSGTLTCNADGLGHAFNNAVGLANAVSFNLTTPVSGNFNASMPSYPGSSIPVALLNTVADAVQSCVNSSGVPAGGGTSNCGTLFADTAPPTGAAAADTLSAAIDLAKFPANPVAVGSGGLYSLVAATAFFQPSLAAAPTDYSLGVFYPGTSGSTTYFAYPYALALDIADDIYVLSADTGTPSNFTKTPVTGTITTTGLASLTQSAGPAPLYAYGSNGSTTLLIPGGLAVDSAQNVYASNPGATATTDYVRKFSGPSGTLTSTFNPTYGTTSAAVLYGNSLAVDKSNNLWMSTLNPSLTTTTRAALYQLPLTGTAAGALTPSNSTDYSTQLVASGGNLNGIAIDQYQNVWSCGQGGNQGLNANSPTIDGFPNAGGAGGTLLTTIAGTSNILGGMSLGGPAIDGSGNIYCPYKLALAFAATPGGTIAAVPTVAQQTYTTGVPNPPNGAQTDGAGFIFSGGRSAAGKMYQIAVTSTAPSVTPFLAAAPTSLDPCYPVTTGTGVYCSDNATAFTTPLYLLNYSISFQIDSTGSVWSTVGANASASGPIGLVQLIGPAAPTWPQLSYGLPGVRP